MCDTKRRSLCLSCAEKQLLRYAQYIAFTRENSGFKFACALNFTIFRGYHILHFTNFAAKNKLMSQNRNILVWLQSISMIVVYIFFIGLLFVGGWYLLNSLFNLPGVFIALYIIVFLLAGGLLGAWIWVLIKLPQGLNKSFDPIKNKIAGREIVSSTEFAVETGRFLVNYFSFFRFDVVAAQVLIKNNKPVFTHPEFARHETDWIDLTAKSQSTEDVITLGKLNINGQSCYGYVVPVWFGNEWLGFFCVYTDTRLNSIRKDFLKEFEEFYVDDQLMHVLNYESTNLSGK